MAAAESRPVVLLYNQVAKTLVEYEVLWTASWLRNIHAAHTGLDRTLIRRDPDTGMHVALGFPWLVRGAEEFLVESGLSSLKETYLQAHLKKLIADV